MVDKKDLEWDEEMVNKATDEAFSKESQLRIDKDVEEKFLSQYGEVSKEEK